jgi:carbon monoxide dehydrogenase subunit G
MPPIVSGIEIARPPDEVFTYVTDPARFAEWQDDVVSGSTEGDGSADVGTRISTTRRVGRVQWTQIQEITEISPPTRWSVRGVDGPIRAGADVTVEPLDGGTRSRVTFALDFEGPGVGRLLIPQIRRMAAKLAPRSYQHLKERLESGDRGHATA